MYPFVYAQGTYEFFETLLSMKYVELGLVPVSQFLYQDNQTLNECLSTLDPEAQRRSRRKFRKLVRQAFRGKKIPKNFNVKQRAVRFLIGHGLMIPDVDD